jgi:KDO2-lipid IV(A) lauroyltransferase
MVYSPVEDRSDTAQSEPYASFSLLERIGIALVSILARLPIKIRSALGWILGYALGLVPLRDQRVASAQVSTFLRPPRPQPIVRGAFANAGATLLESLELRPILKSGRGRVRCDAWDQIEQWASAERPIVALTAHTGNWDLLAAYMIHRGIPITTIGKEARNPAAQLILSRVRRRYGIETLWRSDRRAVKRLVQCLKERRVVAALIDQDTRVESKYIPFFGCPAKTPSSLISLGKRAHARFVSAFLFRVGFTKYQVFAEEFPDDLSEDEILRLYNARLEDLIRRFPTQWVWFHKRWRSRPDGSVLSTREYLASMQKEDFQ